MFIVDTPTKPKIDDVNTVEIRTAHGSVFVSNGFTVEPHKPLPGFIRVCDSPSDRIYWFNMNEIIWIGPKG